MIKLILEYVRTVSPTLSDDFIQVTAAEHVPPMNIIDTAGRTFHKIEELAIQDTGLDILFIVFDITNEDSFKEVKVSRKPFHCIHLLGFGNEIEISSGF